MKRLSRLDPARVMAGAAVLFGVWMIATAIFWIRRSYVPLPFWDQWETVSAYGQLRDGAYGLGDLFGQQNEHRLAFPRLFFFADSLFFHGGDILNLAAISGFQLLHAVLLTRLVGRLDRPLAIAAGAIVFSLMLSLAQWENLTWGFQVQFVDVFAMATAAFMLLASAVGASRRGARTGLFLGCIACLCLAVFSMANGLVAVAVAIVLALALRAPRWMTAALAALLIGLALAYFHHYAPVKQHSTAAYALAHPVDYFRYVLAYLGNLAGPLLMRPPTAPLAVVTALGPSVLGGLAVLATIGMLVRLIARGGKDRAELVLAAIVVFIGLTAAVTAVGRLSFGIGQAYSSRYVTPSVVFWSAQTVFWARAGLQGARWPRALVVAGMGLLALLLLWVQLHVPPLIMQRSVGLRIAQDALLSGISDDALHAAYPDPAEVVRRAPIMKRYRLSSYALPEAQWAGRSLAQIAPLSRPGACLGGFDQAAVPAESPRDIAHVVGWGWDVARRRPAHKVVLTNARLQVVGLGSDGVERPDVQRSLHRIGSRYAGWSGVARTDGGLLHAFLILGDGSACEVGSQPAPIAPSRLLEVPAGAAGPPIRAAVAMNGGWALGGAGLDTPSSPAYARPAEPLFGSWSGDDAKQGTITFGPIVTLDKGIAVALLTGPDSRGQSLVLKDAETGVVYATLQPAPRIEWVWRRVRIPPQAAGRPLLLQGIDRGAGHGQWIGMTAPHAIAF